MLARLNLRNADCCGTCKFCLIQQPVDSPDRYYCNRDGCAPVDGDSLFEEYVKGGGERISKDKWWVWVTRHEVVCANVCDEYRKGAPSDSSADSNNVSEE